MGIVAGSKSGTVNRTIFNMAAVKAGGVEADWSIVVYDDHLDPWEGLRGAAAREGVRLLALRPGSAQPKYLPRGFKGKLIYQWLFLSDLRPHHNAIWLVDDDISFVGFDMGRYVETWASRCAFPHGPPLLSAPVTNQSTQDLWVGNSARWDVSGAAPWSTTLAALLGRERPRAVVVPYLEIQMPLLDAGFFRWFLPQLATGGEASFYYMYERLGTDWAVDTIWCRAAAQYAAENGAAGRAACAVLPEPIDHQNTASLVKDARFVKAGPKMQRWTKERYPQWWARDSLLQAVLDPINVLARGKGDWGDDCAHPDPHSKGINWTNTREHLLASLTHPCLLTSRASLIARALCTTWPHVPSV